MRLLLLSIVALIYFAYKYYRARKKAAEYMKNAAEYMKNYDSLLHQKKSSEIRLGQISENLAPFIDGFKYDPKRAHFLGSPIDYVIFEDDKIVFLEIKSGESKLTKGQSTIKKLIEENKVEFDMMKIK